MLRDPEADSKEEKMHALTLSSHPAFARVRTQNVVLVAIAVVLAASGVLLNFKWAPSEARKELTLVLPMAVFCLMMMLVLMGMHYYQDMVFALLTLTAVFAGVILGYTSDFMLTGILFPALTE